MSWLKFSLCNFFFKILWISAVFSHIIFLYTFIHITKGCGEITVSPLPNALWITTVIHSAFLFFFFYFFFLHFVFQLSPFFLFSFFFTHIIFLYTFIHITKGCGEITVSPHPNALWIITVIHCAFLSFLFQTFPFPFFRFFCLFFFPTSLFFFHFFP